METGLDFLSRQYTLNLTGKEKYCVLSTNKTSNGYLPVGNIIPQTTNFLLLESMRDEEILQPSGFDLNLIVKETTLGNLFNKLFEKINEKVFLRQEEITALIGKYETNILPRVYSSICGFYSAIFFFKEREKVFIAEFKTNSEGNVCEIYPLKDREGEIYKLIHTNCHRVIIRY